MKTISISEFRDRRADVIEDVRATDEPTLVVERSRPAAYIVNPERYERDQVELSALRRALFISEVREAEAEFSSGTAQQVVDIDALLSELRD